MLSGTVLYTGEEHIAVASPSDRDRVLSVDPAAVVKLNGQPAKLADLQPGDSVKYRDVVLEIEATR